MNVKTMILAVLTIAISIVVFYVREPSSVASLAPTTQNSEKIARSAVVQSDINDPLHEEPKPLEATFNLNEQTNVFGVHQYDPLSMIEDIEQDYARFIEGALAKEPYSLYRISQVAKRCSLLYGINNVSDLAVIPDKNMRAWLETLVEPCNKVGSDLFESRDKEVDWSKAYRAFNGEAAVQGSVFAELESSLDSFIATHTGGTASHTYEQAAELVEKSVRTGDFRGYYYASEFYSRLHSIDGRDFTDIETYKWIYAACVEDTRCDKAALHHNLEFQFTSSELNIIVKHQKELAERLIDETPFGFADGWLPKYE